MPSRRYHSKSRHGCGTCKASKVRCDLVKPVCKRCARLERPCSFSGGATSIVAVLASSQGPRKAVSEDTELEPRVVKDLELMHHYSTTTASTMSDTAVNLPIWQFEVPRLAFQHEFLLHGLLAMSALHKLHLDDLGTRTNLGSIARSHQSRALSAYIPTLRHIDEHNSDALFAFSAILGVTSFAFMQQPEEQTTKFEFVKGFIDNFELLVGSTVIAAEGQVWLKSGPLSNLLGPHPFATQIHEYDLEAKLSLESLLDAVRPSESPQSDSSDPDEMWPIYASSAEHLMGLFPARRTDQVGMNKVVGWPALVGSALISRLKVYDETALIILAHYGVALHISDHIWYLKGLGNKLVRAIVELVEEDWRHYLNWPLARTETRAN